MGRGIRIVAWTALRGLILVWTFGCAAGGGGSTGTGSAGGDATTGGGGGAAAAGGAGGQQGSVVSYTRDIQPIWNRYCVECHGIQTPRLAGPDSRSQLDGKTRFVECLQKPFVVAGHPEQSFLYFKLTGTFDVVLPDSCWRLMPAAWNGIADVPLIQIDADAVALVRQWILEGAAN